MIKRHVISVPFFIFIRGAVLIKPYRYLFRDFRYGINDLLSALLYQTKYQPTMIDIGCTLHLFSNTITRTAPINIEQRR